MATPSEVVETQVSDGEIDVPETKGTVSWADIERDSSGWLGNAMQWAYYTNLRRLEPLIHESEDNEFLRLWRHFQTSDHLYYMFAKGGGPGEVHSYFSHFESPVHAFVAAETSLFDFENRVRSAILTANEPFLFCTDTAKENYTGIIAWSLKGFLKAIETVNVKALDFHNRRDDFAKWAEQSLHDETLKLSLGAVKKSKAKGEELRTQILGVVRERFKQVSGLMQDATGLY
jgi:alpha-amylase